MSNNPPFGSPLYNNEEDDFSFPFQPTNDEPIINYPPLIQDQQPSLPTSSLPMSEYQDLSLFLGDDHHLQQDYYTLLGQQYDDHSNILLHDTINWATPIDEQVAVGLDHDQVPQLGGGGGGGNADQYYNNPTTITTTITTIDDRAGGSGGGGGGGEGSSSKKLDHNAKEKVRRMKLNETYLTLRSLLPDSKRAKKRWSAPYLIDRALDYIPQLQAEVEKLTIEKSSMVSVLEKTKQKQVLISDDHHNNLVNKDNKTLTVSMNEVKNGEVIVQICEHNNKTGILSTLIERLEGEGLQVLGASSQRACEDRSCFHLHVQMGENPVEADYVAVLHKKIISWLS